MSPSFFVRWRFTIVLALVFLGPFILRGTRLALQSNRNDVRDWLPSNFPQTADYRWFREHFPYEQFVLCSWEGCNLSDEDDPRLELLARKLVPEPPPKSNAEDSPRTPSHQASNPHAKGGSDRPRYFKRVLTGARLVKELEARYPSLSREEILERLKGSLIGPDYDKTCLVVTLTEEAKGKNLRPMLEEIRRLARQCNIEPKLEEDLRNPLVKACGWLTLTVREMLFGREPPGPGIRMGGPPVDNVAIDVEGERTLFRLAGLSLLVGVGISMACFRSVRLTLMVIWTALLAAGIGLATIFWTCFVARMMGWAEAGWTWGTVDAVMLSMPSLVYVLAISGAVHIVNYYHDAIRESGLELAPERGLAHGWLPCTMAAVTTAIGLGSLFRSHVVPISKFGLYSAVGVLATLGLLFLLLPALLSYFPSRKYAQQHAGEGHAERTDTVIVRWWRMAGGFIVRHNVVVSVACIVVMVFFFFGLYQIKTSVKLMKLFSPDAEIIHHYRWLEGNLGPLVPMEVVIKVDNEKCDLSMLDRMRLAKLVERTIEKRLDAVGGALSAATFAPDIRATRRRASALERLMGADPNRERDYVLNKRLEQHRAEFRDYLTVDAEATLQQLGITGQLAARLDANDLDTLKKIRRHADHQPIADRLAAIGGIGRQQAAEVEDAIRQWESEHGQELWRVNARVDALSDLDYAVFVEELKAVVEPVLARVREQLGLQDEEGIVAVYTGIVPLVYQTQHELMRGLFNSLTMAFVLIAFVMMIVLKSFRAGLVSMIPNVFPVVVIFGIMGWTGILVDVGTMMTASVALGVAVDDTMHYLTWFRRGLDEGLDRKGAAMKAYERCGTAMTQTTLIGGLGLAAFAFSTFTPTQRFGTLMLVLLFTALFGDLMFLPALLTGPLGRVFRSKPKEDASDGPPAGVASEQEPAEGEGVVPPRHTRPSTRHVRRDSPHRWRRIS
jgi:predicted RND superfamily exporter protein